MNLLALLWTSIAIVPPVTETRTFRVDPVLLQGGREVPGVAEHKLEYGRYTYWFASADSRAVFEADPARYEVQLGGACARMGPLSGVGRTEIFLVHDERLYLFASEACRTGFQKAPDRLLETDDPVPEATPETVAEGRRLLADALRAHGGMAAIDAVQRMHSTHVRDVESGGQTYLVSDKLWIEFPDKVRRETWWDEQHWGELVNGERACFFGGGDREMVPSQRRAFDKEVTRDLLWALKSRDVPGTLVTHLEGASDDPVESVAVCRDGSTVILGIDSESGRVVRLRYRGRGPTMAFGEMEERYSDYETVGGVLLPRTREVYFEGKPYEGRSRTLTTLNVNGPLEPDLFETDGS